MHPIPRRHTDLATYYEQGPLVAEMWPLGKDEGEPIRVWKRRGAAATVEIPHWCADVRQTEKCFFEAFRAAFNEALRQDERPWWTQSETAAV